MKPHNSKGPQHIDLPSSLRDVLKAVVAQYCFSSVEFLSSAPEIRSRKLAKTTIQRYLVELKKSGKIYDAGRGWYSRLPEPAILDPGPLEPLVADLKAQFPILDFKIWSTQQLAAYMQHLMAKHLIFVSAERGSLKVLGQTLEEAGYTVFENPGKTEAKKVKPGDKVVVLRPSISQEPGEGPYASAEKVLVDLYIEVEELGFMDKAEYSQIFQNSLKSKRALISELFSYAKRRKIDESKLVKGAESLFSTFSKKV